MTGSLTGSPFGVTLAAALYDAVDAYVLPMLNGDAWLVYGGHKIHHLQPFGHYPFSNLFLLDGMLRSDRPG